jgi:hypothetical protein
MQTGSIEHPARVAPARQASAPDPFRTRIVVVEWKIKKGREAEFLDYWSTRSTIPDRSGLIGEFLSGVEDRDRFPWINWTLDDRWTTFYNVGLWRDSADFEGQIGKFIDNSRPPQDFEAERRTRVFLAPERWRIGATALPGSDPDRGCVRRGASRLRVRVEAQRSHPSALVAPPLIRTKVRTGP